MHQVQSGGSQGAGVPGEEEKQMSGRWESGVSRPPGMAVENAGVGRGRIPGWHRIDNGEGVGRRPHLYFCTTRK